MNYRPLRAEQNDPALVADNTYLIAEFRSTRPQFISGLEERSVLIAERLDTILHFSRDRTPIRLLGNGIDNLLEIGNRFGGSFCD